MGRLIIRICLLLVLLSAVGIPTISFAAEKLPADTTLLERTCTDCHDLEQITGKSAYMAEWQKIVKRMMAYDSNEISQIDKLKVLKYIKENLAIDGPGGRARQEAETGK
ncbi:MAG: hypothetical protein DRH03_03915 [Deltaproteobacteria bacterium]|nr:MAG: hypothetical protein DRH03_03915 [Deltaproteobacteria bacterium]